MCEFKVKRFGQSWGETFALDRQANPPFFLVQHENISLQEMLAKNFRQKNRLKAYSKLLVLTDSSILRSCPA